jgi:hypothetical protein
MCAALPRELPSQQIVTLAANTQGRRMSQTNSILTEEYVHGETVWIAVRSRGADWSWLTPDEAVRIGREWIEKYGPCQQAAE